MSPGRVRRRRRVVAAIAALVAISLAATTAGALPAGARHRRAPSLECGELPTHDVVLRTDLTCGSGFHFGPSDPPVTIDLGGHTLSVPGDAGRCTAPGPCGAIAGASAVRNGTVLGTLSDIGAVTSVLVVGDVEVRPGFAGTPGPASVQRSMILDGKIRVWGSEVTITGNVIRGGVSLVDTNNAVRDVVVERNWIVQSPGAGISVAPDPGSFPNDVSGRFARNVVWGAAGSGIDIRGGVWNLGTLDIDTNLLIGNGGDGFRSGTAASGPPTALGGPVTLTGNVALSNAGHGFDAGWMAGVAGTGIVDGGGNRALANATAPACTGVTC